MPIGVHHLGLAMVAVVAVLGVRATVRALRKKERKAAKQVLLWGAGAMLVSTIWFGVAVVPVFAMVASEASQRSAILSRGISEPGTVLMVGWLVAALLFAAGIAAWVLGER